jgi:acylphosphatase
MPETHRETAFFHGRVQGVGFRYTTLQIAKGFEVAGWVKNLNDGRVELQVEGDPSEIDAFIRAIEETTDGYVRKTERSSVCVEATVRGFSIR